MTSESVHVLGLIGIFKKKLSVDSERVELKEHSGK